VTVCYQEQFHLNLGSKRSQLHKMYQIRCRAKNSWLWAERLPETCRVVIPIKLEFSASVGFIHKEVHKMFSFIARFYILISKFLKMIPFLPICNSNLNLEGISCPRLQSPCSSEGTCKPFTNRYDPTCHKSYTLTCFNLWLPNRIYSIGKKRILLYRNLT
jgi:hypothetical protein